MMKKELNERIKAELKKIEVETGYSRDELIIRVSRQNKKLRPNRWTAFIIWNLPARITCPNRTGLCEGSCYAVKAEKAYPTVLPARMRNLRISRESLFVQRMVYTILSIALRTKKHKIIVRIHESGDFYNKRYAMDWVRIMQLVSFDTRIHFIAYTKSFSFFDGMELPENFSLRASVWADTKVEDLVTISKNHWNIYTAVDRFSDDDTFTQCRCDDCATCEKCWQNYADIRCEIH